MPARYYHFTVPPNSRTPLVDFIALDSSPLTPYVDDVDPKWNAQTYGAEQLQWLQGVLHDSTAPWKIAFAHHPYVSNGGHGRAGHYLTRHASSAYANGAQLRIPIKSATRSDFKAATCNDQR